MKRKKWSELEEQTLLGKYSELSNSGALSKLKTREKKFKPIADHVNAIHHLRDPSVFPFKWSWRDVSIKVQNMRHQYVGVKQKIRLPNDEFNWKDGENHWENFLRYRDVFGDVELSSDFKAKKLPSPDFGSGDHLGLRFGNYQEEDDDDAEEEEEVEEDDSGLKELLGSQALEMGEKRKEIGLRREMRQREREREERVEKREVELEERELAWATREFNKRLRMERELNDERRRRRRMEERKEEEEMEWRERLMGMQMEQEKAMMQMHAEAYQNQMQIVGVMARLVCQLFGSTHDALAGGLGGLAPQVLHHPGDLRDNGKPDANSPPEFL